MDYREISVSSFPVSLFPPTLPPLLPPSLLSSLLPSVLQQRLVERLPFPGSGDRAGFLKIPLI